MEEQPNSTLATVEKEVSGLLGRLLGPASDEIGLVLQEKVRLWRLRNSVRVLRKAEQILSEAGIDPGSVAPKILLPLLDGAALEEDEGLCSKWAALLANAASPSAQSAVLPGFISLLAQMSAPEAKILDLLFDRWHTDKDRNGYLQAESLVQQLGVTGMEYEVFSGNLIRLGLCQYFIMPRLNLPDGHDPNASIHLLPFGLAFVAACRPPAAPAST